MRGRYFACPEKLWEQVSDHAEGIGQSKAHVVRRALETYFAFLKRGSDKFSVLENVAPTGPNGLLEKVNPDKPARIITKPISPPKSVGVRGISAASHDFTEDL